MKVVVSIQRSSEGNAGISCEAPRWRAPVIVTAATHSSGGQYLHKEIKGGEKSCGV